MLVGVKEIEDFPDHKLVVISTGSQGEPLSALRRMAHGDHPQVELRAGDTVVFSATPIPGNERAVNPRYVMPFHGDHRRLRLHGQLAEAVGIDPDSVFLGENGRPLEITGQGARFGESEQAGMIFVDGVDVGDIEDVALRDRRMLSADGIFIVVATIGEQDGRSVAPPEIIFRGVPFLDDADDVVDEIREAVEESIARSAEEEITEISLLQSHLHDDVAKFVYDRLKRRPLVLPVVVEV
jgi:ribonuclease J